MIPRIHCLACACLGLALVLIGAGATDASPTASSAAEPPLRLVFGGDRSYRPFHYLDVDGQPAGFDVELFRRVAREGGFEAEFRLGDWSAALAALEHGEVDAVPMFVSPARARRFAFSAPFLSRYHLVFGPLGADHVPRIEALSGRRVAVQHGGLGWEALRGVDPPVTIVPVAEEALALEIVAEGKADFALAPTSIGYLAIRERGLADLVALSPPLLDRDYAFALAPGRPDLMQRIDLALAEVRRSGELDRLYAEHVEHMLAGSVPREADYLRTVLLALPLLALLVLIGLLWRGARRRALTEAQRAEQEASSRQAAEARLLHLAFHDPVTGLPNRIAFEERLAPLLQDEALALAQAELVRIDLPGLEMLQTLAGPLVAEDMQRVIARRLRETEALHGLASLGRGSFALLLRGTSEPAGKARLGALIARVQQRVELGELVLAQRCRLGVARFPAHGRQPAALLRAADMACLVAQEQGQPLRVYEPDMEPDPRDLTLLAELREAIAGGELGFAVQPKLDLRRRRFVGAEMLARWTHPQRGPLSPGVFVPLAEKAGAIGEMSCYMVQRAIGLLRQWRESGLELSLAVNLSGNDLEEESLGELIASQCGDCGQRLILEVTETELMREPRTVLRRIERLRERGIGIALDDFGTGYSSLTYLRQLAPEELKIDRSFVATMRTSASDRSIVRTSIHLAHELGASVTAEGVEDEATLDLLREFGCDHAQGFGIARPMPVADFLDLQPRQGGAGRLRRMQ